MGKAEARNLGVKASHGQYILHLDQDMELTPTVIEKCVKEIKKGNDAIYIPLNPIIDRNHFLGRCLTLENLVRQSLSGMAESALFFSRRIFEEVGGYDEQIEAPDEADILASVKERGLGMGRIEATIGVRINPSLKGRTFKLFHHAKTYPLYEAKRNLNTTWGLSRHIPFLLKKCIEKNPIHGLGLLVYKTITGIAYLAGYALGYIAVKAVRRPQKCASSKQRSVQELFNRVTESYEKGFKTSLGNRYIDGLEKSILKESLRQCLKDKGLLLDLGVGFGRLSGEFLKLKLEVIGLDISRKMCKKAKRNLNLGNFHAIQATMEALPFKNNSIRLANCFRTLKYVSNHRTVLTEAYRVLMKEGIFIAEVENPLWPFSTPRFFVSKTSTTRRLRPKLFILSHFIEEALHAKFDFVNYCSLVIFPYAIYSKIKNVYQLRVIIGLEKLLSRILPKRIFSRSFLVVLSKERGQ